MKGIRNIKMNPKMKEKDYSMALCNEVQFRFGKKILTQARPKNPPPQVGNIWGLGMPRFCCDGTIERDVRTWVFKGSH